MKNHYFFLTLLLFAACQSASEKTDKVSTNTESIVATPDTNAMINDIRSQYQLIKADSAKDKHQVFEAECDGLFGSINYQLQNDKIRSIIYSSGSDHGGITEEYYLKGDSLLFVFTDAGSWGFDPNNNNAENPKTIDEVIETRYYFHQQAVIKSMRKQVKAPTEQVEKLLASAKNEAVLDAKAADWLQKLADLRAVLKSKKFEAYVCK